MLWFVHRSEKLPRARKQDVPDLAPWRGVGSEEPSGRTLPETQPHREQESCKYIHLTFFSTKKYTKEYMNVYLCYPGVVGQNIITEISVIFVLQV